MFWLHVLTHKVYLLPAANTIAAHYEALFAVGPSDATPQATLLGGTICTVSARRTRSTATGQGGSGVGQGGAGFPEGVGVHGGQWQPLHRQVMRKPQGTSPWMRTTFTADMNMDADEEASLAAAPRQLPSNMVLHARVRHVDRRGCRGWIGSVGRHADPCRCQPRCAPKPRAWCLGMPRFPPPPT